MKHLGIDLGGTKIAAMVLEETGAVLWEGRWPAPQGAYEATLAALARAVDEAEGALGAIDTVGLGTPGSLVAQTGLLHNCNAVWLNDRPLGADFAEHLGRAVALANDANCFALSEATDGAGAGAESVFGIILGTGVGGGWVLRGRVHNGVHGIAGEWGHLPLPASAPGLQALGSRPCWCGRQDCLEQWLSGPGVVKTWAALASSPPENPTGEGLSAAAAAGEAAAQDALGLHARQLAAALAYVVNLLDPEVIVLGGGLSQLDALYTEVPKHWSPGFLTKVVRTQLRPPRYGAASGVRGAAWLGAAGERLAAERV
jgi:predicted NBD/HSP70 family sugar kinase